MPTSTIDSSEIAILDRVLELNTQPLPPEAARALLDLDFGPDDKARMRQLAQKAREGTLNRKEQDAIDSYERVGHLLNVLQSIARRSLKTRRRANGKVKPH